MTDFNVLVGSDVELSRQTSEIRHPLALCSLFSDFPFLMSDFNFLNSELSFPNSEFRIHPPLPLQSLR
jgi:hypothetical protein